MSTVRLVRSARDTAERLTETAPAGCGAGAVKIRLNPRRTFQSVEGFGGAFTEAAAYTFHRMNPDAQRQILESYFHPERGIGYSMGRVHINSCDFALGNYTYVKDGDRELRTFDISREERWVIPLIKAAEETRRSGIRLLASPWSPPGFMKTNGEMNHGGKLLLECAGAWAEYFVKYIQAMRARGLDIWAVTVQNEPAAVQAWDSCVYSAEEEGAFVRDHLGPALWRAGLSDVKLYVWDHNRDIIVQRVLGTLCDPEAAKYVYGVADHWYVAEAFENLSKVHELFPSKHLLFSEGCIEGGPQPGSWAVGERYARNMIGDFTNWQEGWLDWNLILDETGGPNHVGNFCDAPVIADTKAQTLRYNSSYYAIGHFSKFIRRGAKRIEAAPGAETALKHVAFLNEDGVMALVLLNETDNAVAYEAEADGLRVGDAAPAHSISTLLIRP